MDWGTRRERFWKICRLAVKTCRSLPERSEGAASENLEFSMRGRGKKGKGRRGGGGRGRGEGGERQGKRGRQGREGREGEEGRRG